MENHKQSLSPRNGLGLCYGKLQSPGGDIVCVAPAVTGSGRSGVSVHDTVLLLLNKDQKGKAWGGGSGPGRENRQEGGGPRAPAAASAQ